MTTTNQPLQCTVIYLERDAVQDEVPRLRVAAPLLPGRPQLHPGLPVRPPRYIYISYLLFLPIYLFI